MEETPIEEAPVEEAPVQAGLPLLPHPHRLLLRLLLRHPSKRRLPPPPAAYYANCAAVRAAGAAPITAGQPGYYLDPDRDGDGIACEV
ncbi:MAG: excalibur calcium-binding domain-containing protein [Mycobacteriaceae bacterium]|uniref:excalibur calcium-binding domain-containing protein n=1 Tax=Corynebacterium variabile TaxID=1727 RepID=UPI003FB764C2